MNGRKFTGKGDYSSNSIFLPAAGTYSEGKVINQGMQGGYWSSTPNGDSEAYGMAIVQSLQQVGSGAHSISYSVRAVLK